MQLSILKVTTYSTEKRNCTEFEDCICIYTGICTYTKRILWKKAKENQKIEVSTIHESLHKLLKNTIVLWIDMAMAIQLEKGVGIREYSNIESVKS